MTFVYYSISVCARDEIIRASRAQEAREQVLGEGGQRERDSVGICVACIYAYTHIRLCARGDIVYL